MTAQIAIMNKSAIALATDSAVTLGAATADAPKIYQTAEKLFSLSKDHPVGIMVFGNAEFMDVPWETIIKLYRNTLAQQSFARLEDYATHFIRFLEDQNLLFSEAQEEVHIRRAMLAFFGERIREVIDNLIQSKRESGKKLDKRTISAIVDGVIDDAYRWWEATPPLQGIPPDHGESVVERYAETFGQAIDEIFEGLPLSRAAGEHLQRIISYMFSKDSFHSGLTSGVVIAGFGETEPFPSVLAFRMEATVNKRLKYAQEAQAQISFGNSGCVRTFAQDEMVRMFMDGIDPGYRNELENRHKDLLANYRRRLLATLKPIQVQGRRALAKQWEGIGNKLLNQLNECLEEYSTTCYADPVMHAVAALPKQDLAVMAEAMVSLTAFKRRVSLDLETVGGSIDVAVISKGDGFVWVKRKQYASQELNPHLFGDT